MSKANPRFHRVNAVGQAIAPGNGAVRYIIQGTVQGQMTINGFDFVGPNNNPTNTQLTTLLTAISTGLFAKYRALMGTDWTSVIERLNVISSNTILGVNSSANTALAGTGASASGDTIIAAVNIKRSGLKGQHGRGRYSLPAVPTAAYTTSSLIAGAYLTNVATFNTALLASYSDGTNNWTLAITTRSATSPKIATNFATVLTSALQSTLGTIRRRKLGRGK